MTVGDIYRIFVKFGSDTLEEKEHYTVEISKTNFNCWTFRFDYKPVQGQIRLY